MKTKTIKTAFSLADPESRFQFRSLKEDVLLTFQDWSATEVSIKFVNCSHFCCGVIPLKYEDHDEQFLIIEDSQLIKDLDLEAPPTKLCESHKFLLISPLHSFMT